jgi:hypothetical protein
LVDDFVDPRSEGTVIGTHSRSGHKRLGLDVEGVLSIDNGALRIAPLIEAGFGRAVLAYGPFASRPGLAFAVYMLNGHNTAQAQPLLDTFWVRINRWLRGSGTDPRWLRLAWWLWRRQFRRTIKQFKWWKRIASDGQAVCRLNENLAVGLFTTAVEPDPRINGNGFIMHALGPENGELWVGQAAGRTRAMRGVQNVPLYYVGVARGKGTVYYVSSIEGAAGLPPHPWMRPVAVDQQSLGDECYLGVQQSALGQIGFRLDTRIHGVRVGQLAGYEAWWGGAHAAGRFSQSSGPVSVEGEVGGPWIVSAEQTRGGDADAGNCPSDATIAVLDPGAPSGLMHAAATQEKGTLKRMGLVCRYLDPRNHWRLEIRRNTCALVLVLDGIAQVMASRAIDHPIGQQRRLQILDDGNRVMAYVNGEPLSDDWITDMRLREATKVGILFDAAEHGGGSIGSFEAHPRQIRLPEVLDMGAPWLRKGTRVVVADDFSGEQADLDGRRAPVGQTCWRRVIGKGNIEVTGNRFAQIRGSSQRPCPGRTAYCVDWPHPDFVDLEVTITPPGNGIGHGQMTTAGFIVYQDSRNYMTLNAYRANSYPGGSISSFFKFGGFENIYDAVWVNVGARVNYGRPLRLRLCCDGERYLVFVNDEAVLYRAFRDVYPDVKPLQIHKAGLIANWEFGTDTGSTFEEFKLRA